MSSAIPIGIENVTLRARQRIRLTVNTLTTNNKKSINAYMENLRYIVFIAREKDLLLIKVNRKKRSVKTITKRSGGRGLPLYITSTSQPIGLNFPAYFSKLILKLIIWHPYRRALSCERIELSTVYIYVYQVK